jgi:transcriptional regulator with XRE-family HTH domain
MEQVGNLIGVKKSSYASYETKYRQPPLEKLKSFSKIYGVSVDYILGLTDERNIEESIKRQLKEMLVNKELNWDGIEVTEEVLVAVEQLLQKAIGNIYEQQSSNVNSGI